jgi:uroporphyrinogen decarboxylase
VNNNKILKIFKREVSTEVPIWFLRQAGRHIPEYFSIRSKSEKFIDFCLNKDLIIESTKLPLKYYNIDAAIVFSDILMIPWAMNRNVKFVQGQGPVMDPMIPNETIILDNINIIKNLNPLKDALTILRTSLSSDICLIGFAGAPWTLACYMIDGGSSKDFIETRKAVWGSYKWFNKLINTLVIYVVDILEMQAKAGADVLMIFDSWSHMIPSIFWKNFAINPTKEIISNLRKRKIFNPIIGFPFKGGNSIIDYSYESGVDCIALDWTVDLPWAVKNINTEIVIQGNLDPAALISNNINLHKNVDFILSNMVDKRFIFNVGHGLTPECKVENVKAVIKQVKNYKS